MFYVSYMVTINLNHHKFTKDKEKRISISQEKSASIKVGSKREKGTMEICKSHNVINKMVLVSHYISKIILNVNGLKSSIKRSKWLDEFSKEKRTLEPLPPSQPSRSSPSTRQSTLCYIAFSFQLSFLNMVVYISMLLSQFFPHSPSSTMYTSPFSTSTTLLLPCKQVHQ